MQEKKKEKPKHYIHTVPFSSREPEPWIILSTTECHHLNVETQQLFITLQEH